MLFPRCVCSGPLGHITRPLALIVPAALESLVADSASVLSLVIRRVPRVNSASSGGRHGDFLPFLVTVWMTSCVCSPALGQVLVADSLCCANPITCQGGHLPGPVLGTPFGTLVAEGALRDGESHLHMLSPAKLP